MPIPLIVLKPLIAPVLSVIAPYWKKLMPFVKPALSKMLKSRGLRIACAILLLLAVGFLLGSLWKESKPPEVVTVTKTVPVTEFVEVLPPLPECAGFDFNPDIGGMAGDDLVVLTARLYQWAAACSNALHAARR